jgi:transposase
VIETRVRTIHTLTWVRNNQAVKTEAKLDGIFPLLSTDKELSAKEVLQAYKYQPRLEKRFCQFKSVHHAAPLLFKKVARVEGNLFLFFIALTIQALIEREVRNRMTKEGLAALNVYPEEREAVHPTTNKIFDRVAPLATYSIIENGSTVEEFKDPLTEIQGQILSCLDIPETEYWRSIS